jgi:hypothetical protein
VEGLCTKDYEPVIPKKGRTVFGRVKSWGLKTDMLFRLKHTVLTWASLKPFHKCVLIAVNVKISLVGWIAT